ncbi:MAG: hypothetical protein ACW98X_22610, partial [Promethearchaeota archaeon]
MTIPNLHIMRPDLKSEIRDDVDFIVQVYLALKSIKDSFDLQDSIHLPLSIGNIRRQSYPEGKYGDIEKIFINHLGFTSRSYENASNSKIYGQLIEDLKTTLNFFSPRLIKTGQSQIRSNTDPTIINVGPESDENISFNIKNFGINYNPIDGTNFNSLDESLPENSEDRFKVMVTSLSKEIRMHAGIVLTKDTIYEDYYDVDVEGNDNDLNINLIENIIGSTNGSILVQNPGRNTSVDPNLNVNKLARNFNFTSIDENNNQNKVLPFERRVVYDPIKQNTFVPGALFLIESALQRDNAQGTKPLEDYIGELTETSENAVDFIERLLRYSPGQEYFYFESIARKFFEKINESLNTVYDSSTLEELITETVSGALPNFDPGNVDDTNIPPIENTGLLDIGLLIDSKDDQTLKYLIYRYLLDLRDGNVNSASATSSGSPAGEPPEVLGQNPPTSPSRTIDSAPLPPTQGTGGQRRSTTSFPKQTQTLSRTGTTAGSTSVKTSSTSGILSKISTNTITKTEEEKIETKSLDVLTTTKKTRRGVNPPVPNRGTSNSDPRTPPPVEINNGNETEIAFDNDEDIGLQIQNRIEEKYLTIFPQTSDDEIAEFDLGSIVNRLHNYVPTEENSIFNKIIDIYNEINILDYGEVLADLSREAANENIDFVARPFTLKSGLTNNTLLLFVLEGVISALSMGLTIDFRNDSNSYRVSYSRSNIIKVIRDINNAINQNNSSQRSVSNSYFESYQKLKGEELIIRDMLNSVSAISKNIKSSSEKFINFLDPVRSNNREKLNEFMSTNEGKITLENIDRMQAMLSMIGRFKLLQHRNNSFLPANAVMNQNKYKQLKSLLRESPFRGLSADNLRIIPVGLPAGMLEALQNPKFIVGISDSLESSTSDVIEVHIIRKDLEFEDIIFKDKKYLFDMSIFLDEFVKNFSLDEGNSQNAGSLFANLLSKSRLMEPNLLSREVEEINNYSAEELSNLEA